MILKLVSSMNNFSIYLLQKKTPFKSYILDSADILHTKQLDKEFFRGNNQLKIEAGSVIVIERTIVSPDWLNLLNNVITQKDSIKFEDRKDWSAILFLRLEESDHTVAIAFGKMNGVLDEEKMINDFGLITSKQLVHSSNVKYVHIQSFDDKQTKISKQSIKLLNEFQILSPFELNTVKSFKGSTKISGSKLEIGGKMGLRVKGKIDIQNGLLNLLNDVLDAYSTRKSTEPKFKILDTINTVTDPKLLNSLYKKLEDKLENIFVDKINNNKTRKLSIVPDVDMDPETFQGFHISGIGMPTTAKLEDLDLIYIFERVKLRLAQTASKDDILKKIKNLEITCKYENPANNLCISFYKSLCFETTISEAEYIFTGGIWYELNEDFYKRITEKIEQLSEVPALDYINYDTNIHSSENEYNTHLITKTNTIGLDCTKYKPSKTVRERSNISAQSNIELADVLHLKDDTLQFIHVKKKKDASQTNHLFAQAKTSAQLYTKDKINVQKFINEEIETQKLSSIDFNKPYKLQVVLAIIIPKKKKDAKNKKHMFTILERISLYETIEIINSLGFEVLINFIDSDL